MNRRAKAAIGVFGAVLAVSLLHLTNALAPAEDVIRNMLAPIGVFFTSVGTSLSERFRDRGSLDECLERSTDQQRSLASVSVDYVRLRALEEENAVLRKTLGYLETKGYDAVMARVISRAPQPERTVVMIDRGAKDGLENGMAVIVGDGVYAGKITAIQERTATVTMTTDLESRVAVSLTGQRHLIGLVEGQGNRTALATLIPQEEAIKQDDILVTSGTEEKIPANLAVGMINRVNGQPTDPFKSASIEPLMPLEYVEVVAVLRPQALRPNQ